MSEITLTEIEHRLIQAEQNIKELFGKSINGKTITDSNSFAGILLEEALVSLIPCKDFDTDEYVRWSYATSMENITKGLDRLEDFLKKLQ